MQPSELWYWNATGGGNGLGAWEKQQGVSGAANAYEASMGAGDGNEDSYYESYKRIRRQLIPTALLSSTAAQNIGAGGTTPIILGGIFVQTALAGTLTVTGFFDPAGTAVSKIFPVGSVGYLLEFGADLQMDAGCAMTLSVAADSNNGNVVVAWREQ